MSRGQDIPIRPRYGIPEPTSDDESSESMKRTSYATMEHDEEVASSYKEIPFLAQYPDAVPESAEKSISSSEERANSRAPRTLEASTSQTANGDDDSSDLQDEDPTSLEQDAAQALPHDLNDDTPSEARGEMRHFVDENFKEIMRNDNAAHHRKVERLDSASTSGGSGLLPRHFMQAQPQIDANVLADVEIEAQYLAASVDNLTENLCNLLHSISSITADNVELHKNSVNKLTDCMDANIKCMYTIMAKTEEISKSMRPTEQLGQRIREIKRLVDMLDTAM